ncbi:hypothetical protein HELRODRAFT_153940 [Helobdella robusta]|uniref:Complexin n=1 Tax=Helobdella robusta TaxID=6412 RepID=T1ELD2_HELRO|nr:hypothetical protein HELRODRAFT_153940 [Helobdella robusta]ESO12311.1 hypothetical protein HELRODRAFT_153940 [Helobdella robusta]
MVSLLGGGLLGNPLSGALEDKDDKKDGDEEEDPEVLEAKREAEERRNEKYRKMEEERETMRQGIRDKYHIQKKEVPKEDPGLEGRLGRKKRDDEGSDPLHPSASGTQATGFPKNLDDLTAKVKDLPGTVMTTVTEATDKCSLQ